MLGKDLTRLSTRNATVIAVFHPLNQARMPVAFAGFSLALPVTSGTTITSGLAPTNARFFLKKMAVTGGSNNRPKTSTAIAAAMSPLAKPPILMRQQMTPIAQRAMVSSNFMAEKGVDALYKRCGGENIFWYGLRVCL